MGVSESIHIDEKFCGFRVYKIIPGGPLENAGIKELEDFIIPPADLNLNKQPFYEYIRINAGKKIPLSIYSLATRTFSDFEISPGLNEKGQGFLGATVRYENWSTADKNLLRVLRVRENSLANKKLGLIPGDDFIIAIRPDDEDIITLNKADIEPLDYFSEILSDNKYKPIEFFIYNSKTGARFVKAILSEQIDEVLGCDVAYGKLHEFPKVNKRFQREQVSKGMIEKKDEKIENNNDGQTVNDLSSIIEIENKKEDGNKTLFTQTETEVVKENNIKLDDTGIDKEDDIIVETHKDDIIDN